MKTLTLKCPCCNAGLEITADMDRFACGHCGTEQVVERRGGTVALKLVVDAIERVQSGTDRTAAELALCRINEEIAALELETHQIKSVRSTHLSPMTLLILGSVGLVGFLLALSAGWESAPVFVVISVLLFLLAVAGRYQADPGKVRLDEIQKMHRVLTEKQV